MPSNVQIANLALTKLDVDRIMNFNEDNESARKVLAVYDMTRDMMLAKHPWNFATKRVALAQVTGTPAYGFTYIYQLPADCLRVLETDLDDDNVDYKIEENKRLLTDELSVKIKYIARIEDPIQFSQGFILAFYHELVAVLAYAFTNSRPLAVDAEALAAAKLRVGKSLDAQEGKPDELKSNTWKDSRLL